jgi:aconitate hydratase A / 2-methylisocitrate dehydratase
MAKNNTHTLTVGSKRYQYYSLADAGFDLAALPVSLKILAENVLRNHDGATVTDAHVAALAAWPRTRAIEGEIPFFPLRILMPDSSGIPLLADLAVMRDAMAERGGDPARVKPLIPLDLVVDHSVIVETTGTADAAEKNLALEFARNQERYAFLRWAQMSFDGLNVVPPGNGICHQINLEKLATVVQTLSRNGETVACPDAMVGMDSHTAMVNGLGVLGWGVGGIEAATAMLGEPLGVQVPSVVGCRLVGRLQPGVTTTDLVLSVTQRLRQHGVIGAFVEFCGEGVASLALPERATLANMCPEYGATVALFPIDAQTIRYLALTGREEEHVALVEAYAKAQGLWHDAAHEPVFNDVVEIDLAEIAPSAAGPRRPHERLALDAVSASFAKVVGDKPAGDRPAKRGDTLQDGDVVIAAITSCTNTSNPSVMVAAGLLARNAVRRGLKKKEWVKTSLAPGSRVVADYLARSGLQGDLDALGFNLAGYGCTTCMGNSGALAEDIADAIAANDLTVAAVLSGNRNFESRVHPLAKANYLVSPPLVVAYAIAGSVQRDLTREPLGEGKDGAPVFLREIWPDDAEVQGVMAQAIDRELFHSRYRNGFSGSAAWDKLSYMLGLRFGWDPTSTHIKPPPFFDGLTAEPAPVTDIIGARALALLGDSVTTDHISPVGIIPPEGDAGRFLQMHQVGARQLGSYMERRVNHDVMVRGTFANLQLQNEMTPGKRGGFTRHAPSGHEMTIFAAARRYAEEGTPVIVVAGREYGAGSSRDWAAKGTRLLGIRAVVAESFERIHRSNLIGMGVLPLQFADGVTRASLKLDGRERFDIVGLADDLRPKGSVTCRVSGPDGRVQEIVLVVRLDTAREVDWYGHGGVLTYALRRLLAA